MKSGNVRFLSFWVWTMLFVWCNLLPTSYLNIFSCKLFCLCRFPSAVSSWASSSAKQDILGRDSRLVFLCRLGDRYMLRMFEAAPSSLPLVDVGSIVIDQVLEGSCLSTQTLWCWILVCLANTIFHLALWRYRWSFVHPGSSSMAK